MMRSAGNFSPEWGYLAPVPSMLRTVRVVLVATAVGATAGAGVVLSLVDHPTADGDRVAVAGHAIVTSAQAVPVQASQAVNGAALIAPLVADVKADTRPNVIAASVSGPLHSAAAMQAAQQPQQVQVQAAQPEQGGMAPPTQVSSSQASPVKAAPANETRAASIPEQPAVAALSNPSGAVAATSEPSAATDDTAAADMSDQSFVGPQQPPQQKKPKHHTAVANNRDFIGAALRRLFSARAPYSPSRGL